MSILDLNAEQRAAVMAQEPRVLVLAGAGSGKTRTLVERVAHLIEHGASGYEIACTTFTRAAAGEMRKRLESRIGPEAHKVALSTFHGLGLGLLQKYGHHIGLRYGRLTVFSPLEADMLRQHCAERIGLYAKRKWRIPKREVEREWARLELSDSRPPDTPTGKLYAMFQAACLTHNAVPYSGLVSGLLDLAKQGKIREFTNWKYFLVDEVQDLDPLQWRTLRAMLNNRDGHRSEVMVLRHYQHVRDAQKKAAVEAIPAAAGCAQTDVYKQ